MFPHASWTEEIVILERGDLLCVYTDGVTEALNAAEEEFGMDRLSQVLVSQGSPDEICREVFEKVSAFAADVPQYDDQTLLLLRRVG
jgi:sigma-B regulation protein RsbU (phosphoserine phosphatase)